MHVDAHLKCFYFVVFHFVASEKLQKYHSISIYVTLFAAFLTTLVQPGTIIIKTSNLAAK